MFIFQQLEEFYWPLGAIFAASLFALFAISGVLLVRRLVNIKTLRAGHDVAGFVFTNLGVLYGVLLGFTVVNAQQRFDSLVQIVENEASILSQLYHDAALFAVDERNQVRSVIQEYVEDVLSDEWKLMAEGLQSEKTKQTVKRIWNSYYSMTLSDQKQTIWYTESIQKLNQLMEKRLARLVNSEASLGSEMWSLLIVGGLIVIAFTWFFGLESIVAQAIMASILASITAFLLFLIYSLDTAFGGSISISPEAMERVLEAMRNA